jgi:predicted Zn finger-like uncharacterized protein
MTDSFVTQCPHCQTSFRVSHAQLSVARGAVRCGACLQVFNAAKQLLAQRAAGSQVATPEVIEQAPLPETAPTPIAEPHLPAVKPQARQLDLDNLDLDDLDVELARLEQREIQLPPSFGRTGTTRDVERVESMSARRGDADTAHESWNEALTNDDVDQLPELHAQVIDERDPTALHESPFEPDDEQHATHDNRTEPSFSRHTDDFDDELHTRPAFADRDVDTRQALNDRDEAESPTPRKNRNRNEPALRDEALLDLMDDPLQLDWQKPRPRWGLRLLWMLLVLIVMGALAGQYVYYHFDELARQDKYRPVFQALCPQVGCKVPAKVDIKLLKSSNLVVRNHPEFQGALVVDAIIYNRASFAQPFPLLELKFSDASGQVIANRRFKPAEYLSGELAGKDEMPPQTPIHIALDVLNPNTKAVNYGLSFLSPE